MSLENQAGWAGPDTKDLQESVTRRPVREQHLLESPPTPRTIKLDPRLPLPPHLTAPTAGRRVSEEGGSDERRGKNKQTQKSAPLLFQHDTEPGEEWSYREQRQRRRERV